MTASVGIGGIVTLAAMGSPELADVPERFTPCRPRLLQIYRAQQTGGGGLYVRDTRLVQTAVIGDEHSDVPVVLPTEAIQLDAFRRLHDHDTFWCGLLLGGCGAQLAHKLYLDRQCHFQHHPQPGGAPHDCRRPKIGRSSADHLSCPRSSPRGTRT